MSVIQIVKDLKSKEARMAWAVLRHNETFRINVSVVA